MTERPNSGDGALGEAFFTEVEQSTGPTPVPVENPAAPSPTGPGRHRRRNARWRRGGSKSE